jgi:drug/metabolite transporter (DMT)-like permease
VLGALVAILSALSFSLSDVSVRRGVAWAPASQGAFVTILLGVPLFAVAALITGQLLKLGELSGEGYLLLALAGIVHYVVGRFFNYAAIGAIGAARSSPIQSLTLPYSVLVAYFTLGEGVTTGMAFGMGLILLGPAIIVERSSAAVRAAAPPTPTAVAPPPAAEALAGGFELRQAEGYAFALIAAISYGSSPVLIRAALEDVSGVSILGGLVSYVAAAALLLATLLIPGRRHLAAAFRWPVVRAFAPASFFVFMAQMFRFIALSLASVAVVATLLRFAGVFTLLFSWWFNRSLEKITWRVVAGVMMSVAGAILLVLTRAD